MDVYDDFSEGETRKSSPETGTRIFSCELIVDFTTFSFCFFFLLKGGSETLWELGEFFSADDEFFNEVH